MRAMVCACALPACLDVSICTHGTASACSCEIIRTNQSAVLSASAPQLITAKKKRSKTVKRNTATDAQKTSTGPLILFHHRDLNALLEQRLILMQCLVVLMEMSIRSGATAATVCYCGSCLLLPRPSSQEEKTG
jgi:hypothetical protein